MKPRDAREVRIGQRQLRLVNLDKVLYPQAGFTKAQVIDYYVRISAALLPHLRGRPLTLKRYPNGVDRPFFYEKRCPEHRPPWLRTAEADGIRYCVIDDLPSLVWAANLADLELHVPLARAQAVHRPDFLVFDLDPGAPAELVQCCEVGLLLRGLFESLRIACFAKTSGSKGLQVYVPLNVPEVTYEDTKPFARAVAETLERERPSLIVSNMKKSLRTGKVLVDWSQNDPHKTTVCVHSLRAKDRPTVSTPVTWDEVEECAAGKARLVFEAEAARSRVEERGDLFAPVLEMKQKLPRLGQARGKEPGEARRFPRAATGLPPQSPAARRRR